jgi:type VI secretion system protein ImpJ
LTLRGLFEFQAMLTDLDGGVNPHPYSLFWALRRLYAEVCILRDVHPHEIERPYDHLELSTCFGGLLDALEQQVEGGRQGVPYVEFVRKEGLLVCKLSKEARRAKEVFWLVQKPQVGTVLDVARVKLASESRLRVVHERALRGIPFVRIESPPFHHGLSSNVEFFALQPGQEWDYAVREGMVVLHETQALQGTRMYLYWRSE